MADFFDAPGDPATDAEIESAPLRTIWASIAAAFAKIAGYTGNGGKILAISAGGTAQEAITTTGTGSGVRATSPSFTTGVISASTTLAVFNTVATTINAFGGCSVALNIGHASGVNTILGATTFSQAMTLSSTVNKVTITPPATSATLTLVTGSSLITSGAYAITLTASATTNATLPAGTNNIGYLEVPQNSQNAGYTCVLGDSGKHIYMATAGTFTIPANASVAYPIGTAITFVNLTTACTIPITSDTMYLAGAGTTGTRTLAQYGIATALKTSSTVWIISGNGLS